MTKAEKAHAKRLNKKTKALKQKNKSTKPKVTLQGNVDNVADDENYAANLMLFKHSREYQINKDIKDQDNEMLDNMAWQAIQKNNKIIWD